MSKGQLVVALRGVGYVLDTLASFLTESKCVLTRYLIGRVCDVHCDQRGDDEG